MSKRSGGSDLWIWALVALAGPWVSSAPSASLELAGISVTPHVLADSMQYRREPEPAQGARVQLFLLNSGAPNSKPLPLDVTLRTLFDGRAPRELLKREEWAWHDTPSATPLERAELPPGALTIWTFNGRKSPFGPGGSFPFEIGPPDQPWLDQNLQIDSPKCWLSAVTFLGPDGAIRPDTIVIHIANETETALEVRSCRLWLPAGAKTPRILVPQPATTELEFFNGHSTIPSHDRGGMRVKAPPLPLTYTALQVQVGPPGQDSFSIWCYLRIKVERFDISGGWVNDGRNSVSNEVFLKTLKRFHVNTAHLGITPGYSDTELLERYPLKYFGALTPVEVYDTDDMLRRIHAVEFLGEPQYGGGHPVPPQTVWEKLHPYSTTRLPTTLTNSEERVWRDYAGLSDYPHYDAYRVTAPSADAWRKYDRWGGIRIGWGAPLETIGDMCRSLRELSRPLPCAVWSQGPHSGWEVYGGRERTSPTPDEIRLQAYHALSTRITSLYWFNLSLESLVRWRDTLPQLEQIGREIRLLDDFLLEGDAYGFERLSTPEGELDWDVSSVCGPDAALLFALDLDYTPDREEKVFKFGPPRTAQWTFRLPDYLAGISDVFRVDGEGTYTVDWSREGGGRVVIRDQASGVAVYIASLNVGLRSSIDSERKSLIEEESALEFDPGRNDADFEQLKNLAGKKGSEP
ncbi:MAG: hypothetical protein HUU16_01015 [Candidatus Omnitrophica bacterium]|nr:hypothetical protein [Candidatus Omnitrophota bacterium]